MHITIIQGAFLPVPPVQGGACEKIWYRMGREFAKMGHEVVHISRSYLNLPDNQHSDGVIYKRILGYNTPSSLLKLKTLDLLYSIRALKLIDKKTDIIITNTFWSPFLLRGNKGRKMYVSVERIPRGQMKFYTHAGILRGCSPAICNAIKKEISENSQNIVSFIPNPIPFDIKSIATDKKNTILFVGRLHPEKGIHILIEAFKKVHNEYQKDWELVIIGPFEFKDGGGGNTYLQQLKKLSQNNIKILDPVFDENLLALHYAKAKIFCYPAQEGSGDAAPVSPREAMAYGCVPVVSKLDCFNDFIVDKKNGLVYDQNNKNQAYELFKTLQILINDESYLKRLSEEAKQISQRFSATVIAEEFIEDFRKISCAK